VTTEVVSALSLKERAGALSAADRSRADETYRKLQQDVLEIVHVRPSAFTQAAAFACRAALSLRSGNALHLAIAAENRAQLCTRDLTQAQAGRRLGSMSSSSAKGRMSDRPVLGCAASDRADGGLWITESGATAPVGDDGAADPCDVAPGAAGRGDIDLDGSDERVRSRLSQR